ncbi:SIS domain-containing protein [Tepidiforma sp.]|uniref:SIS domain-containing protein n=1 Tax=Tepidiforma sp. TaxID=2682230 RepID=UPI00261BCC68|nr:SIS domain-containing protein [Tepidiforma sp.]MCX7617292.1 SIS domain-containing protein [Tepidiforma sp.]
MSAAFEPEPAAAAVDRAGMWRHIAAFGGQLAREWRRTADLELPLPRGRMPDHLVIAATGGSAAAGDIVAALAAPVSEIPITVVRGRELPNFVGERTLVAAVSCSGNTAETLALYDDAWRRDAPIIAITRGGRLAARCEDDGVPAWRFDYDAPPRAAVALLLAPLLRIVERLGLYLVTTPDIERAAALCAGLAAAQLAAGSAAARAAGAIAGRVPLILAGGVLLPLADRARNQLAENAKLLAASAALPEAAHNLVVGLDPDLAPARWTLLALAAEDDPAAPYLEAVEELAAPRGIPFHRLPIPGSSPFERALAALVTVDALSWHAAIARGIDPTPIPEIESIRSRIARLSSAEIST